MVRRTYSLGVDSVIRGFSEGMRHVREGDRLIITMNRSSLTGSEKGNKELTLHRWIVVTNRS